MNAQLVICVPVRGPIKALTRTIAALNDELLSDSEIKNAILLIANSGGLLNQLSWDGHLEIITLSSDKYWSAVF